MASQEWLATYRTYGDDELATEVAFLKKQVSNPYVAMGVGSKNHTRDMADLRSRLHAATRIQQERGTSANLTPRENSEWGVPDFSQARF